MSTLSLFTRSNFNSLENIKTFSSEERILSLHLSRNKLVTNLNFNNIPQRTIKSEKKKSLISNLTLTKTSD